MRLTPHLIREVPPTWVTQTDTLQKAVPRVPPRHRPCVLALPLLHVTLVALGSLMIQSLVPLVALDFSDEYGVERSRRTLGIRVQQPQLETPGQACVWPSSRSAVLSPSCGVCPLVLTTALTFPQKPLVFLTHFF
uniref:Uncharacterized protein n=1 Tax=Myotis myotis TaxID=51298 RepID=A0A7J7Y0L0_MYOMY|nr:hypothetical protein mMyoMyo1_011488 [Myotis myotis]